MVDDTVKAVCGQDGTYDGKLLLVCVVNCVCVGLADSALKVETLIVVAVLQERG